MLGPRDRRGATRRAQSVRTGPTKCHHRHPREEQDHRHEGRGSPPSAPSNPVPYAKGDGAEGERHYKGDEEIDREHLVCPWRVSAG